MARELTFVYNGKTYDCGTIIVFKGNGTCSDYTRVFLCYVPDTDSFWYQSQTGGTMYEISGHDFRDKLKEVKDEICVPIRDSYIKSTNGYNRAPTLKEELVDDNLLIAWIWYIFIMAVAIIFKDRIGIWILASYVFFKYRRKKLRERGFKL